MHVGSAFKVVMFYTIRFLCQLSYLYSGSYLCISILRFM